MSDINSRINSLLVSSSSQSFKYNSYLAGLKTYLHEKKGMGKRV